MLCHHISYFKKKNILPISWKVSISPKKSFYPSLIKTTMNGKSLYSFFLCKRDRIHTHSNIALHKTRASWPITIGRSALLISLPHGPEEGPGKGCRKYLVCAHVTCGSFFAHFNLVKVFPTSHFLPTWNEDEMKTSQSFFHGIYV